MIAGNGLVVLLLACSDCQQACIAGCEQQRASPELWGP